MNIDLVGPKHHYGLPVGIGAYGSYVINEGFLFVDLFLISEVLLQVCFTVDSLFQGYTCAFSHSSIFLAMLYGSEEFTTPWRDVLPSTMGLNSIIRSLESSYDGLSCEQYLTWGKCGKCGMLSSRLLHLFWLLSFSHQHVYFHLVWNLLVDLPNCS